MVKTTLMVLGLATVVAAGTACFGMFSDAPKPSAQPCAGLEGQAKADCEAAAKR